jgi:hypothetical protein
MTTPKMQALGITQEGSATRWRAMGYVDGVGWLHACGQTLIAAMEALQAKAKKRVAAQANQAGKLDVQEGHEKR